MKSHTKPESPFVSVPWPSLTFR